MKKTDRILSEKFDSILYSSVLIFCTSLVAIMIVSVGRCCN